MTPVPAADTPRPAGAYAAMAVFRSIAATRDERLFARAVAEETPVAIELNGIGYAVLMCTPAALEDLAAGFLLSERLIGAATDIIDLDTHQTPHGLLLRITLVRDRVALVHDRVRHRVSESSCGLCGIENLEQALRPLPRLQSARQPAPQAVFAALQALGNHQPLNRATGGVHAAAACGSDGGIRLVREDVGRHNAFDKLVGAMARSGQSWDGGFALLSSRCSFELVEKAVLADCPALVTISAATSLALDRAAGAGLPLRVLARSDAILAPMQP